MDEAINNYKRLSKEIFSSTLENATTKFDANILEDRFKELIATSPLRLSPDAPLKDSRACKTFVVSTRTRAGGSAVRMKSYDTLSSDAFAEPIWMAARATSAAPTLFDPITIDDVKYGDGSTGWNNPTQEAIAEAHSIWPDRKVRCLVSLGTGLERALQLDDMKQSMPILVSEVVKRTDQGMLFNVAVADYCVECLTSCERTHRRISDSLELLGLAGAYFRLNVPQGMSEIGLEEWKKLGDMIALTNDYMNSGDITRMKQRIASLLLNS